MLHSINWLNFIAWLPLIFEICDNVYIAVAVVCFPVFDLINFRIYFSFLNKALSYVSKETEQKFKYLKNKKSF